MIDAHSHMLMDGDETGVKRRRVEDLGEIDLPKLFERMDRLGIEHTVSVVQETRRVWRRWTGTNDPEGPSPTSRAAQRRVRDETGKFIRKDPPQEGGDSS